MIRQPKSFCREHVKADLYKLDFLIHIAVVYLDVKRCALVHHIYASVFFVLSAGDNGEIECYSQALLRIQKRKDLIDARE